MSGFLQPLHRHGVSDQEHVGDRIAGLDLGHQLGHDLGRALAHPFDLDTGIGRLERIDGRLRILVRLASIEHQIIGVGRGRKQARDESAGNGGNK
ncbi:hypothetical protein D9M72_510320 [compost metagenome]